MFLEDFVKRETSTYDESHDFNHAVAVFTNTSKIAQSLSLNHLYNDDFNPFHVIEMASYLHDVCDHKYDDSNEKKERLYQYINTSSTPKETKIIIDIIDNMSFSKQKKGLAKNLGEYQILLDIISDADKLEALGQTGINRCIKYTETYAHKEDIERLVKQHCYDKLLLLKDYYIKTLLGKKLAEPLHQVIVDYVNNH